jgi:dihydroorotate dehydrogenase electron transfer subunit
MIQVLADVSEIEAEDNGPFVRVALGAPEVCASLAAGRFVLADLGGLLREALFPARVEPQFLEVLVSPDHAIASLKPGVQVSIIGPLGNGYSIPAATRRLLLVADVPHVPVLLPLVALGAPWDRDITLLLAADTVAQLYPLRLLPPAVEVHIATTDGSAGRPGDLAGSFTELVGWADHICIAADPVSYPALARIVRERRVVPAVAFAEALVSPPMACGVGACQGCAVATNEGVRLACTDGPVFDLLDLHGR